MKYVGSKDKMNYEEVKKVENLKRKRHIKKSYSQFIKDEERTFDLNNNSDFSTNWQYFVLLNISVAIIASFLACGCFFVLVSSNYVRKHPSERNAGLNISQANYESIFSNDGLSLDKR